MLRENAWRLRVKGRGAYGEWGKDSSILHQDKEFIQILSFLFENKILEDQKGSSNLPHDNWLSYFKSYNI